METEIKSKIAYAISHNLSNGELQKIYDEAAQYLESLPQSKRGDFYWSSCMEILTMMIEGLK